LSLPTQADAFTSVENEGLEIMPATVTKPPRLSQIRKDRAAAISRMEALDAACCVDGKYREMTEDEQKKYDDDMDLCGRLEALAARIKNRAELKDEDDEQDEEEDPTEEDEDEETDEEDDVRTVRTSGKKAKRGERQSLPIGRSPAIHTKDHKYDLLRAMRLNLEGHEQNGVEGEVDKELRSKWEKNAPPKGFLMPLGNERRLGKLLYGRGGIEGYIKRRHLTTTTGTGAVFVVPELPFIELLRTKLVLSQLGVTFLTGMQGKFSIPRQSGAGSAFWVAESAAVTASNQTLDQVAFVDKTLGAATNISRKFIYQSSVDAESFVKNDLAMVLAIAIEQAAINGSGSGATPTGIMQNSTIQSNSSALALGASGGAMSWAAAVGMETLVSENNADRGRLAYLTSPALRGDLKQRPKQGVGQSSTFPVFIWENDQLVGPQSLPRGEVNGYPAFATNNVPSNLTKGSGTGLSGLIFGNWEDLVVATWGGIDVVVNPFSNQLSGAITISMLMEADVEIRHPESFAIITDALSAPL
jgi:HK97 family phage major capsid protein